MRHSPQHRRLAPRLLVTLWSVAAVGLLTSSVRADSGALRVDRQDAQADTPVDPHGGDGQLHVAVATGTQAAHSYVHLDFGALPKGIVIQELKLILTQNASPIDNANTPAAALHAGPLTQELPAKYDSSKPPQWDCKKADVGGLSDGNGHWSFNLQPLAAGWDQIGNTGAAILPQIEPPVVGS